MKNQKILTVIYRQTQMWSTKSLDDNSITQLSNTREIILLLGYKLYSFHFYYFLILEGF